MNGRVLAAGWPFAGLLALDASRTGVADAEPVLGHIVENDHKAGILVLKSDDVPSPIVTHAATGLYGVDGYPITRWDLQVGDMVEAVQERKGEEWVTTKVRVLRPAPRPGPGTR
jgi:hypothetical protein